MTTTIRPLPHRAAHTIAEARHLLGGIAPATIYALIQRGELRTFKVGRRRFVSNDALHDYIVAAERATAATADSEV
ncbi:MAG: helix-turn-helix domain-containing protein [Woeseia sp.]